MKYVVIIIATLIASFSYAAGTAKPNEATAKSSATMPETTVCKKEINYVKENKLEEAESCLAELLNKAAKKHGYEGIEITRVSKLGIYFTVNINSWQIYQSEKIGLDMAKSTMKWMLAHGWDNTGPFRIKSHVRVEMREKGETGKAMKRQFGVASYNQDSDSFIWTPTTKATGAQ